MALVQAPRHYNARTLPLLARILPVARAAVAMSCRVPASSPGALSATQEVAEGDPYGRNWFDLLENELLTRIIDLLSAKELVRLAASCKRFAKLEKESSDLKHAQLCAHFTAAGAPDTVAWLTSNRGECSPPSSSSLARRTVSWSGWSRHLGTSHFCSPTQSFSPLWSDTSRMTRRLYILLWLTQELCMLPRSIAERLLMKQKTLRVVRLRTSWISMW